MNSRKIAIVLVFLLAVLSYVGCSSDPPNKTENGRKDYVVYGWSNNRRENCVTYHTATGKVDSFAIPITSMSGMTISPDGSKLYLSRLRGISVLDVATREIISEIPHGSELPVLFSPDGSVIAIQWPGLYLLRCSDDSVIHHSTGRSWSATFSRDSKLFYHQYGDTLICVRTDNGSVLWQRSVRFDPYGTMVISRDDGTLYDYSWYGGHLRGYDIAGDSMLPEAPVGYGVSNMVISPNGSRIYLTSGGDMDSPPAPFTFAVYDVLFNKKLDSVRILATAERCVYGQYATGGYLAMSPDGLLFVTESLRRNSIGLVVYDPTRPDTAKIVCTKREMSYLTCQTKP